MGSNESESDDVILERLRESASGDAAVRQLRRRYDMLRQDYERLLDRLGELEDRLAAGATTPPPTTTSAPAAPAAAGSLAEVILAPLMKLRDDYVAAVSGINTVVTGLESLAAGAFKGQHGTAARAPATDPQAPVRGEEPTAPETVRKRIQVDVRGRGFGELLDFQERLSSLEGVARVSINAIDAERATLVVELHQSSRPLPDA